LNRKDADIIYEDLYELMERVREKYTLAGFLSVVHSVTILKTALEKQIAKKSIKKPRTHSGGSLCPTCNKIYFNDEIVPNYCNGCGQRLLID